MGDEAHVGLVDSHAEGDRRDDHHVLAGDEGGLVGRAHLRLEPGVIGQHRAPGRRGQLLGQLLDLGPGRGIDDARPRLGAHQRCELARRALSRWRMA